MTPKTLRGILEIWAKGDSAKWLADLINAHAAAWEAQLKTSPWQIGVELIEAKSRIEVLEKRLEAAVALGKAQCYKHANGDDACMCEQWDALAGEEKP